jgi:hypothetical protein
MALFSPSSQNPLGLPPGRPEKCRVKLRNSDGSKGQIVYFDLAASDGEVTASTNFGGATNPTSNVILATNAHDGNSDTTGFLYGVLAEDITENGEGWCYYRGVIQALGGDTTAAGECLSVGAGSELVVAAADHVNIMAISLETMADATLKWVIFDGINGIAKGADIA